MAVNITKKKSVIIYFVVKLMWLRESYIIFCTRNDISGIARFKADT
jgi:hypothetical protein